MSPIPTPHEINRVCSWTGPVTWRETAALLRPCSTGWRQGAPSGSLYATLATSIGRESPGSPVLSTAPTRCSEASCLSTPSEN